MNDTFTTSSSSLFSGRNFLFFFRFRGALEHFAVAVVQLLATRLSSFEKLFTHTHTYTRTHTGSFYTSITNFMQGYIDNEVNLNADGRCGGTCHNYASARNYNCQNGTLCGHSNFQKTTCSGDIFDCDTLEANGVACLTVTFDIIHLPKAKCK